MMNFEFNWIIAALILILFLIMPINAVSDWSYYELEPILTEYGDGWTDNYYPDGTKTHRSCFEHTSFKFIIFICMDNFHYYFIHILYTHCHT